MDTTKLIKMSEYEWMILIERAMRVPGIQSVTTHLHSLTARTLSCALNALSVTLLAITQPISLKAICDPKIANDTTKIDPTQPPILMIHGFLGRSSNMIYHRHSLVNRKPKPGSEEKKIKNIFTVDLGTPFHSIEEYAKVVHTRVLEINKLTGRKDLIIVAHSMGGLVADAYKKLYATQDGITIIVRITMGTPLEGTPVAYLASLFSKAARQMKPSSDFIKYRTMKSNDTFKNEAGNFVTQKKSLSIQIGQKPYTQANAYQTEQ